MPVKENSTRRHAWSLRQQVLHGPPAKGDSTRRIATAESCGKPRARIACLRGARTPAEVLRAEPDQKPPRGLVAAAHNNCSLGASHRASFRLDGHRSRCGADTPGLAAKRCSASGDAYAIHDQCERHQSPGTKSVPRWPFTGLLLRSGCRGEWLTIRAIDKRTFTSPPVCVHT